MIAAISVIRICFWHCNRRDRPWIYYSLGCKFLILTLIHEANVSYWEFGLGEKKSTQRTAASFLQVEGVKSYCSWSHGV